MQATAGFHMGKRWQTGGGGWSDQCAKGRGAATQHASHTACKPSAQRRAVGTPAGGASSPDGARWQRAPSRPRRPSSVQAAAESDALTTSAAAEPGQRPAARSAAQAWPMGRACGLAAGALAGAADVASLQGPSRSRVGSSQPSMAQANRTAAADRASASAGGGGRGSPWRPGTYIDGRQPAGSTGQQSSPDVLRATEEAPLQRGL